MTASGKKPTKPKPKAAKIVDKGDIVAKVAGVTVELPHEAFMKFMTTGEIDEAVLSPTLLRYLAGVIYATDLAGVTATDLAHRSPFSGRVSAPTMSAWSQQDHWGDARRAVWAEWRQRVVDAFGESIVKFRSDTLDDLAKIRTKIMKAIDDDVGNLFFKELDGAKVVKALTMLITTQQSLLEMKHTGGENSGDLDGNVNEDGPGAQKGLPETYVDGELAPLMKAPGELSDVEAGAMARALLEVRANPPAPMKTMKPSHMPPAASIRKPEAKAHPGVVPPKKAKKKPPTKGKP